MRFFKGITALDYSGNESASLQKEGGTIGIIRRIEPIPGKLLPSRACFRLAQRRNIQNHKLYLQPVEKDGHLLTHFIEQTPPRKTEMFVKIESNNSIKLS